MNSKIQECKYKMITIIRYGEITVWLHFPKICSTEKQTNIGPILFKIDLMVPPIYN